MQCKDVQNKFIPFINDELNQKELKEFLGHIHQCKNCYEEYDIYYTMIMGMRYLEEESEKNWIDSEERLCIAQEYLRRHHIIYLGKLAFLAVLCIGCMFLL